MKTTNVYGTCSVCSKAIVKSSHSSILSWAHIGPPPAGKVYDHPAQAQS